MREWASRGFPNQRGNGDICTIVFPPGDYLVDLPDNSGLIATKDDIEIVVMDGARLFGRNAASDDYQLFRFDRCDNAT